MQINSLSKLIVRGAFLLSPFALLMILELFILPIDFFTFRVWESLLASPYRYPGVFYPNMHVIKNQEYGDRYRLLPPSENKPKRVEWWTDSYGYRNRPNMEKLDKYDAVILGDSNIVGSSLDQKNTLAEVLGSKGKINAYSYSVGSDHIALFYSDPRFLNKYVKTIVVESRVGVWLTNDSYLANFSDAKNDHLEIVDRSKEFNYFYDKNRNLFLERFYSRLQKMAMYKWAKATLRTDFEIKKQKEYIGNPLSPNVSEEVEGDKFIPNNWTLYGSATTLDAFSHVAIRIRSSDGAGYWHTERFISSKEDGSVVVKFEARNSVAKSSHAYYIFEDGAYRQVGTFAATNVWRSYEIPIKANKGSVLEFQIDQADNWQALEIRNIKILGAKSAYIADSRFMRELLLSNWTDVMPTNGALDSKIVKSCNSFNCRAWEYIGPGKYIQSSTFDIKDGFAGYSVKFNARADSKNLKFFPIYMFEGNKYKVVTNMLYGDNWASYEFIIHPSSRENIKLQIDLPENSRFFEISDFSITPVNLIKN